MTDAAEKPEVVLALGGGGARGIAHLGVIEGIEEAGYQISHVLGISIGSLAGSMYAFDPDIKRVQQKTLDYLNGEEFKRFEHRLQLSRSSSKETDGETSPSRWDRIMKVVRANYVCQQIVRLPSLLKGELLVHAAEHLLPDSDIADAKVPLGIVAVDLLAGDRLVMNHGPVRDAVRGSSSIPGIFPPVEFGERLLCDIGVLNSLPVTAAEDLAHSSKLIAVDVSAEVQPVNECSTAVDVLVRMHEVGERLFREQVRRQADLVIRPEVGHRSWFEFQDPEVLIDLGRKAARHALESA